MDKKLYYFDCLLVYMNLLLIRIQHIGILEKREQILHLKEIKIIIKYYFFYIY